MDFSQKLLALMARDGMTHRALGEAVGVSAGAVTGWVKNGAKPRPGVLRALADHFGLTVTDLTDESVDLPRVVMDDPAPYSAKASARLGAEFEAALEAVRSVTAFARKAGLGTDEANRMIEKVVKETLKNG